MSMDRREWERRFGARIKEKGISEDDQPLGDEVVKAELESWPQSDDEWLRVSPEEAADESMSYWSE